MVHDNIRLVDWKDKKLPWFKIRKIKLKKISFQSVYENWRNFRISLYQKLLENRQDNLLNMGFNANQLSNMTALQRSENRVLRKTKVIAKLESKIRFLETGRYETEEFINNRAIKLKNSMMQSLMWNKDCVYKVPEEVKETFFAEPQPVPENIETVQQETPVQSAEDNNLEKQNGVEKHDKADQVRVSEENDVSSSAEISNTQAQPEVQEVHAEHATEQAQSVLTEQEQVVEEAEVKNMESTQEETPIVTNDEVADAIKTEMEKIKVTSNESSSAKVNKYIAEDGTYRLKREDIDDEFRVTNVNDNSQETMTSIPEINIPPFNEVVERTIDFDIVQEENMFPGAQNNESLEMQVQQEVTDTEDIRKDMQNETNEDDNPNVSELATNLSALLEKVRSLSERRERLAAERAQVEATAMETDKAYVEKVNKLATYAEFLENDCAATERETSETKATTMARQAEINAIELMLEQSDISKGTRRM